MSRLGADPGQLEELAAKMASNAESVDGAIRQADQLLEQTWWEGEDARIFREQWVNGRLQLGQLTATLREAGSFAARAAGEQRMASR